MNGLMKLMLGFDAQLFIYNTRKRFTYEIYSIDVSVRLEIHEGEVFRIDLIECTQLINGKNTESYFSNESLALIEMTWNRNKNLKTVQNANS